jgi:hypothetical protein
MEEIAEAEEREAEEARQKKQKGSQGESQEKRRDIQVESEPTIDEDNLDYDDFVS